MKRCNDCGQEKPHEQFPKSVRNRDGLHSYCKECANRRAREYYARNPGKGIAREQQRRINDPEHYERVYRNAHLKRKFGVTLEFYEWLFAEQQGKCAICGRAEKKLIIDHDHTTGHIRALLCSRCNVGLGQFEDDAVLIRRALTYLEQAA